MPEPTPGAQRISLADRVGAAWDALRGKTALPFSPGQPVGPIGPDAEQGMGPRAFQYPVAVNTVITPRSEYPGAGLIPFSQLRALARLYNVARLCINVRIEEMQALEWGIVARNSKEQSALQPACDALRARFESPDGINDFSDWLGTWLRDMFEVDAATLYPERDRLGRLRHLIPIDGTTIKPLLNGRGQVAGYQQLLYGAPRSEYLRAEANDLDEALPTYWVNPTTRRHQLYYWPYWVSVDSPYGSPPAEAVIMTVNTALRKQNMDMLRWTEGNIPSGIATPPEGLMNPEQLRQFEDAFNADLAGVDRTRARLKFIPWAMNIKEFAPFEYNTAVDEWLLKITCAGYGVTPSEIGFTGDVNRAAAGHQENVQYRRSIGPLAAWISRRLTAIIRNDFGIDGVQFKFMFGEAEDKAAAATTDKVYAVDIGAISADEVRAMRFPNLDGKAPGKPQPPAPAGAAPAPAPEIPTAAAVAKRKRRRVRAGDVRVTPDVLTAAAALYREVRGG